MYQLGSGDWITLKEAAQLCSMELGVPEGRAAKTEEDVLKMGYMNYENLSGRLKIYTFARKPLEIRPAEASDELRRLLPDHPYKDEITGEEKTFSHWGNALTEGEKKAATEIRIAGDVFELNWTILEKVALLHHWHTGAAHSAIIRAEWHEELPGWEHNPPDGNGQGEYWSTVFEGDVVPDVEILWDDLRVDRVELQNLLNEAKAGGGKLGDPKRKADKKVDPREIGSVSAIIAALAKVAEIDISSKKGRKDLKEIIAGKLGIDLDERTIAKFLNFAIEASGKPIQLKD